MPWTARRAGDDYGAHGDPDWRSIDWREHLRSTEIEGRPARYVDLGSGDGPPIVFVHGLAGCWQNWLENLPFFARARRVIAPDLPGFGGSEMPAEEISISGYGRFVEALCAQLDLGEVAIVGNSMGGFVSAEVAIQFPQRVERLVLVSAAGITSTSLRQGPVMTWGRVAAVAGARSAAEKRMAVLRPRLRYATFSPIVRHPRLISAEMLWEMSQGAGRPGFMPALRAHLDYDFRDRLPDIRCPTLIVWGSDDMIIPSHDADEYERSIRGARKVVFEDTGHVPMIERPPTFNECLLEFVREPRREQTADVGEPAAGVGS
ncbi:MAG: alpha/beta fold hydrolase [Actinobacteria bacterium]|nr:alpha/beta fold hydrolase [Actinomycetota bacterium]